MLHTGLCRGYVSKEMEVEMALDESRSEIRENLFGGEGAVRIWNCLTSHPTEPFKAALWCQLDPGGFVGRHRQTEYPEVVLCVGGIGRAVVGGQAHSLVRGNMVYLPLGATLSLHNESDEVALEYVIIKAEGAQVGT